MTALTETLASPARLASALPSLDLLTPAIIAKGAALAAVLKTASSDERHIATRTLATRVQVNPAGVTTTLNLASLGLGGETGSIVTQATLGTSKARLTLVVPGQATAAPDTSLIAAVAQARAWLADLTSGQQPSLHQLAQASGVTPAYVRRLIGAAFLAPDLVTRIVEGRQPRWLTLARLTDMLPLPADWSLQRALFHAAN